MDMQSKPHHQEEYGYNNAAISDRIIINWSPPENYNYICKRRFGSPRILSKSVPRRNRNFIQYRINRSLNFDIASIKSPDKSLENSIEGINLLSRSAKIMKALNLNHTLNSSKSKKIKKSLNFDTTPSPKRFMGKSPKNISLSSSFNTPLSRLSRTLNFDSSPSDSSIMLSSVESIDENQNQTPSHRDSILNEPYYMTPNFKSQSRSPCNVNSQKLRSGLKEKIDRIVQIGATPNICSSKRNKIQMKNLNISGTNPARNLFNDFQEIDNHVYHNGEGNDNDRPSTPENVFLVVAESTSAIKKSHKKERLSGRINHLPLQVDAPRRTCFFIKSHQQSERKAETPESEDKESSINESYDKDRNLEKEFSDDGSIFDYSECRDHNSTKSNTSKTNNSTRLDKKDSTALSTTPTITVTSPKPQEKVERTTPPNRIDFLAHVVAESIKKSHKKIKDQNRRSLFKGKILNLKDEGTKPSNRDEIQDATSEKKERANTPENLHSSRLLLNEFSSVKKSHKKEKQSKMISGFLKRQKYMNRDLTSNSDDPKTSGAFLSLDDGIGTEIEVTDNKSTADQISPISSPVKLSPNKRKIFDDFVHDPSTNLYHDEFLSSHSKSSTCKFKIYTPIKKRKSLIFNENEDESSVQVIAMEKSRCSTPINCDSKSIDFCTPQRNETNGTTTEPNAIPENPNGTSTPKNMSTVELLPNLGSIKVSHKKDKRASYLGKSLNYNGHGTSHQINVGNSTSSDTSILLQSLPSSDSSFDNDIVRLDVESDIDLDSKELRPDYRNSQPSTSKEGINNCDVIGNTPSKKTPPNKLHVKNIIQLMQTTSIKKSHKKERNRRKHSGSAKFISKLDLNLSDDGSIFDEKEKIAIEDVPIPTRSTNGMKDLESNGEVHGSS